MTWDEIGFEQPGRRFLQSGGCVLDPLCRLAVPKMSIANQPPEPMKPPDLNATKFHSVNSNLGASHDWEGQGQLNEGVRNKALNAGALRPLPRLSIIR